MAAQELDLNALVIGEIVFDQVTAVLLSGDRKEPVNHIGGAPANFLYHLTQLGGRGKLLSAVGGDELGKEALRILGEAGIDLSLVQENAFDTGLVPVIKYLSTGQHEFDILEKRAFDYLVELTIAKAAAREADIIYYGTLALRDQETSSRKTILNLIDSNPSAVKFCDINLRKGCWTPKTLKKAISRATIVKLNDEEVPVVLNALDPTFKVSPDDSRSTAELSELLWEKIKGLYGAKTLMVTQGKDGALAISKEKEMAYHPGFNVPKELIKDTIGCGDAAAAGFVHAYTQGESLDSCLELANRRGALVAMLDGAMGEVNSDMELSVRVPEVEQLEGGDRGRGASRGGMFE